MGAQPPYGPAELSAPPLSGEAFLAQLGQQWQGKCQQPSPFFQAMYDGKLKQEDLQAWVKDWYNYWDDGVVYSTASLFVKNNDEPMRTHILRRIVDIEGEDLVEEHSGSQTPAWEELWLRFGEGIGVPRRETESAKPYSRTYFAVQTLRSYSRYWDWSWLDGVATLYASDLYGQEFLGRAYDALKNQYHVPDHALEFFRVYLGDIESHFGWEKEALAYWCCTTERQLTAARAFRERIDIDQQLLVGLEQSCIQGEPFFQIP
jgi:pyrroloquinoline quinone (PQQ) biosynthesis protein C